MLTTAVAITIGAAAVVAAPSPVRSVGGVPVVDSYIPFSGKVPRTSKYPGLKHPLCDNIYPSGEGQGSQVSFDAPDGGSQYTVNLTIAGESYNLIFDTGRLVLRRPH